jgi:hypothetical protein
MEQKNEGAPAAGGGGGGGDGTPYGELCNDPDMQKYIKMLKMRVPPPAVLMKMKAETEENNLTSDKIAIFAEHHHLGGGGGKQKGAAGKAEGGDKGKSKGDKRKSTMRKIHWNEMDQARAKDSVFQQRRQSVHSAAVQTVSAAERQEMLKHFGLESVKEPTKKKPTKQKEKKTSLLDSRRTNNIGIGLAKLKNVLENWYNKDCERRGLKVPERTKDDWDKSLVKKALLSGVGNGMNNDNWSTLREMLPNQMEMRKVSGYRGPLDQLGDVDRSVWYIR